jgi:hypothetical protein
MKIASLQHWLCPIRGSRVSQKFCTPQRDRLPGLRTGQTVSNSQKITTFKQRAGARVEIKSIRSSHPYWA